MKSMTISRINLVLFGDAGAPGPAGSPAAQAAAAPAAAQAEASAAEGVKEVRYGKQSAAAETKSTPPAEAKPAEPVKSAQQLAEENRKAFRSLIRGEYKDAFAEETQRLINRRFKEADGMRRRLDSMQPLVDVLSQRYGINGMENPAGLAKEISADSAFWADAAEKAGMTVETYRRMRETELERDRMREHERDMQREYIANLQYEKWAREEKEMQETYPDFTLESMKGNQIFALLLKNGYPMMEAYKAATVDNLISRAAADAEEKVTSNIKARGQRPSEAGVAPSPAFIEKNDVNKLDRDDVLKVMADIANGKHVTFG